MNKGLRPRPAVQKMAPYHPPTGGRQGKLRLDFNENTVGCSPKVIEYLKEKLTADALTVYPEYLDAMRELAAYFAVAPGELLLSNGTDEHRAGVADLREQTAVVQRQVFRRQSVGHLDGLI